MAVPGVPVKLIFTPSRICHDYYRPGDEPLPG
jgi:hypothetical protein